MEHFTQMASGILKCIQFTYDSPARNADGQKPGLDTILWIAHQDREYGIPKQIVPPDIQIPARAGTLKQVIRYKLYRKAKAKQTPFSSR